MSEFVKVPEKEVPVAYDVDVAVAGGGVSGVFAALAAARNGARTVIIDRFGCLGGNMGPGMIHGGALNIKKQHKDSQWDDTVYGGMTGMPKEFFQEFAARGGGCVVPYSAHEPYQPRGFYAGCHYLRDSNAASYVIMKMLEEAGVEFVLSAYAGDPIMEGDKMSGILVENKSGTQAVKAGVVIDATGEADVARRAGAPIIYPQPMSYAKVGLYFVVGSVNWNRYDEHKKTTPANKLKEAEDDALGDMVDESLMLTKDIEGLCKVGARILNRQMAEENFASGSVNPLKPNEAVDSSNGNQISTFEAAMRMLAFETLEYYRANVPGFENAYMLTLAPFLGARGGPCIEGEYTLTMEDCEAGKRFSDVLYLYGSVAALRYNCEQGECKWVDFPYRVMVPKKIDGLLAVGRSASGIPDKLIRNRYAAMYMGQACGTAAALAVKEGVDPRNLEVKKLQLALFDAGFYLGDRTRLKELDLL